MFEGVGAINIEGEYQKFEKKQSAIRLDVDRKCASVVGALLKKRMNLKNTMETW